MDFKLIINCVNLIDWRHPFKLHLFDFFTAPVNVLCSVFYMTCKTFFHSMEEHQMTQFVEDKLLIYVTFNSLLVLKAI